MILSAAACSNDNSKTSPAEDSSSAVSVMSEDNSFNVSSTSDRSAEQYEMSRTEPSAAISEMSENNASRELSENDSTDNLSVFDSTKSVVNMDEGLEAATKWCWRWKRERSLPQKTVQR